MAKRKRNIFIRIFIFLVVIAVLCGAAFFLGMTSYDLIMTIHDDQDNQNIYADDMRDGYVFEIIKGSNTLQIADKLYDEGIIKNKEMFVIWSKINGYDYLYKSGRHLINYNLKVTGLLGYDRLMRILVENPLSNPEVKLLLREGLTYSQMTDIFMRNGLIELDRFNEVANEFDPGYNFIKDIPDREKKLEGYLFPETYLFPIPFELEEKGSEKEVLQILLRQFNKIFKPEYYERAAAIGMTVDEIITMASLIEKEAQDPEEREKIAGVFYNRLKSDTRYLNHLQSCATIQYALLETTGETKELLSNEDLKIDHPYNTYEIFGLPPGPICNPGLASIIAALYPDEHDFYYFVAVGDGTHDFSKTDAEHQKKTEKYQN